MTENHMKYECRYRKTSSLSVYLHNSQMYSKTRTRLLWETFITEVKKCVVKTVSVFLCISSVGRVRPDQQGISFYKTDEYLSSR